MDEKSAVALGLFDGIHIGHRAVLSRVSERGAYIPTVFTFPADMANQKERGGYLYSQDQKLWLLENCHGIQRIFSPSFASVCSLTGEEFATQILRDTLHCAIAVCGEDFHFGQRAACDVRNLEQFGKRYGFAVEIVKDLCVDGERISSSAIRERLVKGDIESVNALLGDPYLLRTTVEHGKQIGRTIGFPTINQYFENGQLVPRYGVYTGRAFLDGKEYQTLTNIGEKPTVSSEGIPLAETYILDYTGDLYGCCVTISLEHYLRPEKKFDTLRELTAQMQRDLTTIREGKLYG